MVPLIKTRSMVQLTLCGALTFPKLNESQPLAIVSEMQLPFSFFSQPHFCLVWIHLWKTFLGIIDPLHTLCCERGTHVAGALKCSYVEISVFWNVLTFCPAKHHFFFFWNHIINAIPTTNLIFKKGEKKIWLSTRPFAELFSDKWNKLKPFFSFSVLINIMGHRGNFSCKCISLWKLRLSCARVERERCWEALWWQASRTGLAIQPSDMSQILLEGQVLGFSTRERNFCNSRST